MSYFDFNSAEQASFELIPKDTLVRLRLTLKPGGFDDASQGWTGGWATRSPETGAVYLACEGVVLDGPYARRKLWWNIGLHSPKGPTWQAMGRSFIRSLLNSARRIHPADTGPQAQNARRIAGFAELDGLEFAGRIDIEKDGRGNDRNTVRAVIEPDHKDYAQLMGQHFAPPVPTSPSGAIPAAATPAYAPSAPTASSAIPGGKPAWAQ
ncbi:hypothetical protein [Methylococcus capsulatus]|jgi:hypothetical protein|uniref:Uncharacterized protein n=1 Tax=Methylococcus capsulatus TaxID=414 RepID=A0AA35XV59_METCP|nr:hypothetical protein [Methylococcus capsulatus]QXP89582.1 hypothetical protein KW114_10765 [Methylococcus capsulatus]CAI8820198.1 conserved protein of unknown function [Methylococcus capsulatus]